MTDMDERTVSNEELQALQVQAGHTEEVWKAAERRFERAVEDEVTAHRAFVIARQAFEAAGGTKELLRRSVEREKSNA